MAGVVADGELEMMIVGWLVATGAVDPMSAAGTTP